MEKDYIEDIVLEGYKTRNSYSLAKKIEVEVTAIVKKK